MPPLTAIYLAIASMTGSTSMQPAMMVMPLAISLKPVWLVMDRGVMGQAALSTKRSNGRGDARKVAPFRGQAAFWRGRLFISMTKR